MRPLAPEIQDTLLHDVGVAYSRQVVDICRLLKLGRCVLLGLRLQGFWPPQGSVVVGGYEARTGTTQSVIQSGFCLVQLEFLNIETIFQFIVIVLHGIERVTFILHFFAKPQKGGELRTRGPGIQNANSLNKTRV